jgi:hypothetical protein
MKLGKKLKTLLALLILTSFSSQAIAQTPELPGQFRQVVEGEPAPFAGWCFDDTATGALLSTIETSEESCALTLKLRLAEQKARLDLEIGKLSLRYDTLKKQSTDILILKDQEIKDLEAAALKRPNDYVVWWGLGGFIIGSATASFILYSVR